MNEIQAVKTAKIEEVKKNSKKGFTLVELVVVIAILAILAAIAIPVVSSTIKSSQISSAKSNAQTIELAIKEAKAAVSSGDDSVFTVTVGGSGGTGGTTYKASDDTLRVCDVAAAKKIESAFKAEYKLDGKTYKCYYDQTNQKVYYIASAAAASGGTATNTVIGEDGATTTTTLGTLKELAPKGTIITDKVSSL